MQTSHSAVASLAELRVHRRAHRAGRLRQGLLRALLPPGLSARLPQDRPLLRGQDGGRRAELRRSSRRSSAWLMRWGSRWSPRASRPRSSWCSCAVSGVTVGRVGCSPPRCRPTDFHQRLALGGPSHGVVRMPGRLSAAGHARRHGPSTTVAVTRSRATTVRSQRMPARSAPTSASMPAAYATPERVGADRRRSAQRQLGCQPARARHVVAASMPRSGDGSSTGASEPNASVAPDSLQRTPRVGERRPLRPLRVRHDPVRNRVRRLHRRDDADAREARDVGGVDALGVLDARTPHRPRARAVARARRARAALHRRRSRAGRR